MKSAACRQAAFGVTGTAAGAVFVGLSLVGARLASLGIHAARLPANNRKKNRFLFTHKPDWQSSSHPATPAAALENPVGDTLSLLLGGAQPPSALKRQIS